MNKRDGYLLECLWMVHGVSLKLSRPGDLLVPNQPESDVLPRVPAWIWAGPVYSFDCPGHLVSCRHKLEPFSSLDLFVALMLPIRQPFILICFLFLPSLTHYSCFHTRIKSNELPLSSRILILQTCMPQSF